MTKRFLNYFSDKERSTLARFSKLRTMWSKPLIPFLKKMHMTPDLISYGALSLLIPVCLLFVSYPVVTLILLIVYGCLDGLDGSYARLTNTATQGGALTDIFCDQVGVVVIGLCFIYYKFLEPTLGAYYLIVYTTMIAFAVIQNYMNIKMQFLFRSKYLLYVLYFYWAFAKVSYVNYAVIIFALVHTMSCIKSFRSVKKYLNKSANFPKKLKKQKIYADCCKSEYIILGVFALFWTLFGVVLRLVE